MKPLRQEGLRRLVRALVVWSVGVGAMIANNVAFAHNVTGDPEHPHYDWSVKPPETVAPGWIVAQAGPATNRSRAAAPAAAPVVPAQAASFTAFAPRVKVRWDDAFLYVESNGLPLHGMMVGITAWQQQVPLPQAYVGDNAWRIPLRPEVAANPVSIKGRFLRGAIALAANGIPIFNPQNNRGEVSAEIGELDQWGGHCGRADDYHYHAAPLHLQAVVGKNLPIAYALDGYAIYGLTEPDGATPGNLDAFNGHETSALGYHYHASTRYPYVNGGFHGVVVERGGQVDPQPRAQSVRRDQPPLRGAKITEFTAAPDEKSFALRYAVNGKPAAVNYAAAGEGAWKFTFVSAGGATSEETYRAGDRRGGGGPGGGNGGPPPGRGSPPPPPADARPASDFQAPAPGAMFTPKRSGNMVLTSPVVAAGGPLPVEFTGDGASVTPPLGWKGAPDGTQSYAVVMHHLDPEGKVKWYWTLYNLPSSVQSLPKDVHGVGVLGNNSVNGRVGYAPPHSKGPGAKTYILTVYALSAMVSVATPPAATSRDVLLMAMKDLILDSAELKVVYTRTGTDDERPNDRGPGGKKKGGKRP